ncbi:MAG: hypothetical protein AMXMBFR34_17530 [Myxococcaceae bacterium]
MTGMRMVKGTVVGKTIVLDEALPEGTAVDVVVHEARDEEDFVLTDDMHRELDEAADAIKRGEAVDMDEVLAEVDRL